MQQSLLYSLPPLIRFRCRRCSCQQMGAWPEILYAWWCHHCGWGLVCPHFHLARSNWRVIWALVVGWPAWRMLCPLQETGWRERNLKEVTSIPRKYKSCMHYRHQYSRSLKPGLKFEAEVLILTGETTSPGLETTGLGLLLRSPVTQHAWHKYRRHVHSPLTCTWQVPAWERETTSFEG